MPTEVSYTEAINNLSSILDQVINDCDVVVIKRRGNKRVALISAAELSSMMENEYLFPSSKNRHQRNESEST